jgi:sugar/nucleoside kinase (ribokinase family)
MQLHAFPNENHKMAARNCFTQAGGPIVRALLLLRRFGEATRLIGAVGDDLFGKLVRSELDRHGVDTTWVVSDPEAATRIAHVWLAANTGSRTIAYSPAGPEVIAEVDGAVLDNAAVLLLDGRHPRPASRLASLALGRGVSVAIDMGNYKERLSDLVNAANIVIGPRVTWARLAQEHGYSTPLEAMMNLGEATCVLTDGPERVLAVDGGHGIEYNPAPVLAVDSNGAGDVFFAAFVWARMNQQPIAPAIRFASCAAATKCGRLGNEKLPLLEDILAEYPGLDRRR